MSQLTRLISDLRGFAEVSPIGDEELTRLRKTIIAETGGALRPALDDLAIRSHYWLCKALKHALDNSTGAFDGNYTPGLGMFDLYVTGDVDDVRELTYFPTQTAADTWGLGVDSPGWWFSPHLPTLPTKGAGAGEKYVIPATLANYSAPGQLHIDTYTSNGVFVAAYAFNIDAPPIPWKFLAGLQVVAADGSFVDL